MFEMIVITVLSFGPGLSAEYNQRNPDSAVAACTTEQVKSENGNYFYRRVIDDGKGCTFSG